MVAEPFHNPKTRTPTVEELDILHRRCTVNFRAGTAGRNVTDTTLPWYFVSLIESAGFFNFSSHLNPMENESFENFYHRIRTTCANGNNTSKLELYFKATRSQRLDHESANTFINRTLDAWSRIPQEFSLKELQKEMKIEKLTTSDGDFNLQKIQHFLDDCKERIEHIITANQAATILLGLRNDNWALQTLAHVEGALFNGKKIEEYLIQTQNLQQNITTTSQQQAFLTNNVTDTSFLAQSAETAFITAKYCKHKRRTKSCWTCTPCEKCKQKGKCEHRGTRADSDMSLLSALMAQAQESADRKLTNNILHSRIVIFDSGCSTAMVSRGWIKKYPSSISNITPTPTIRIATANGPVVSTHSCSLNLPSSGKEQTIRCKILETDTIIPPLIGESALPYFKYDSKSGDMIFERDSTINWRKDTLTNLRFICLVSAQSNQTIRNLIYKLHCESNHSTATDMKQIVRKIPRNILQRTLIDEVIKSCDCQLAKYNHNRITSTMTTTAHNSKQHRQHCDVLTGLPSNEKGYVGVLLIKDSVTKMIFANNIKSHASSEISSKLQEIYNNSTSPYPTTFVTDGEKSLTSTDVQIEMINRGLEINTSPPGRHQNNGDAENTCRYFIQSLRCYIQEKGIQMNEWYTATAAVVRRMNNHPHKGRSTPYEMAFSINPHEVIIEQIVEESSTILRSRFGIGEHILYCRADLKNTPGFNKLHNPWIKGIVVGIHGKHQRTIQLVDTSRHAKVHINNLKKDTSFTEPNKDNDPPGDDTSIIQDSIIPQNTSKDLTNSNAVDTQNAKQDQENEEQVTHEIGTNILFNDDGTAYMGEIISIHTENETYTIHLKGSQAATGEHVSRRKFLKTWQIITQRTNSVVYATSEPPKRNNKRFEPILCIVPFAFVITKINLMNNVLSLDDYWKYHPSNARKLPSLTTLLSVMIAATTHQRITLTKLSQTDKEEAMEAFHNEMQKYIDYETYDKVNLRDIPRNATVLRTHLVFTLKQMKTGERKFKARCVIDGSQDHRNLYSATNNADQTEIRTVLHMASTHPSYNGDLLTADVENGYFHANTDGIIYVIPPKIHADHGNYAWLLKKNVYGIPNAGKLFEDFIIESLQQLGWTQIQGLRHSWIKMHNNNIQGYLCVYVDDFLAVGIKLSARQILEEIKTKMKLNIDENGSLTFTGTSFDIKKECISIHQQKYIDSLLPVEQLKSHATPLPYRINEKEDRTDQLNSKLVTKYREKLGQLLFIARDSRPDLSYAASFLGKFSSAPTIQAMKLLNRAITYAATNPYIMRYPSKFHKTTLNIECFVDASLGNNNNVHAQTGYIIFINETPFYWKSKRQTRVARSSTKAEMNALHDIFDKLEFYSTIFSNAKIPHSIRVYSDSADAIHLLNSPHPKPKESAMIFPIMKTREQLNKVHMAALNDTIKSTNDGKTKILHISGDRNIADGLTKAASSSMLLESQYSLNGNKKNRGGGEEFVKA